MTNNTISIDCIASSTSPKIPTALRDYANSQATNESPALESETTLYFKNRPIRIAEHNGVPWFALPDVGEALGLCSYGMEVVDDPAFPAFAKIMSKELPDDEIPGEPEEVLLLSPVGVWYFTALQTDPKRGEALAAWARRETRRICPNPTPGDPAVFLTLLPGPTLPPYPWKYSGRRSEWLGLKYSNDWLFQRCPSMHTA